MAFKKGDRVTIEGCEGTFKVQKVEQHQLFVSQPYTFGGELFIHRRYVDKAKARHAK